MTTRATAQTVAADLGVVQETLLIPLYGRAVETRKKRPMLRDEKAVEMVDAIEYDFRKLEGSRGLIGSVLRTAIYDEWVKAFIAAHPEGTVVEIGCGLNTRFERVGDGSVWWFDLDLPDVIALRRRFFEDGPRRKMLPASITDRDWVAIVRSKPGPYLFVAEGVFVYLDDAEVKQALALIAAEFPGARLAFDTMSTWALRRQRQRDVLEAVAAHMRWGCDDPRALETWGLGLQLCESRTLADAPPALRSKIPWFFRHIGPWLMRRQIQAYRLNLFEAALPLGCAR